MGTYNAAVGCDAGEEDDHAIGADIDFGVGFAHGEGVGAFGEDLVGEEIVACDAVSCIHIR